jgi:two-component system sensor histidine kinase AlgZ
VANYKQSLKSSGDSINSTGRNFKGDFLPDLCTVQAVFHLILVGELLAIALTVAQSGVLTFSWNRLGVLSMLIQWIVLASAACLCPLRPWFKRRHPMVAGMISYLLVLCITMLFSVFGAYLQSPSSSVSGDLLLTNFMLAAVFAGIVLRYFYLQQQLRNQQQAELNARIQALQARIRPHFLFNSMNSIASLIDFDPQAAEKMVVDLSELFRASLSDPGLIPLERELELCRRFVAIEQMRIGERLQVSWDVDELPGAVIPSLLLQPLVENAVYHGIQPLLDGGTVVISVKAVGSQCQIRVRNPVGDKRQTSNRGNGLALDNIRHRLDAHYGAKGSLHVNADAAQYEVIMVFPQVPPAVT